MLFDRREAPRRVAARPAAARAFRDANLPGPGLTAAGGQAPAAPEAPRLYVEGEPVEQYYWVDYVKVTPENAADYL